MRLLVTALLALSLGCSESEPVTADPAPVPEEEKPPVEEEPIEGALTYYTDIKPILDTMCVRCHSEGQIRENSPLDTYEGVKALAPLIKEKVTDRTMPPWLATHGCKEYAYDESLDEDEIATISEWADTGATMGDENATPAEVRARTFATLTREDVTIEMPLDYTMVKSPDEYRCFLLDWPEDEHKYITGFGAKPGNPNVVHHIIAYLVPPAQVETFEKYDTDDDGPGYECFGGPTGMGGMQSLGVRFLGGWAPGGVGGDTPPGTGMPIAPGSKIALQLHYNTLDTEPAPDRTSVVFKLSDDVDHEAFIMPWANFAWISGAGMNIPKGEADVMHTWASDPWKLPFFDTSDKRLRLYSASLHMHTLGSYGSVFVNRKSGDKAGETECLLNIDQYDFGWQRNYGFMEPVDLAPGDELGLECHWDNTQANQQWVDNEQLEPVDQKWGEGTTDEMCVAFFYAVAFKE